MPSEIPRCGDHVLHRPTGEEWVVAWAEGNSLAWAGWPNGIALLSDCEVTRRCTDAEHAHAVWRWSKVTDDPRAGRVARLYGDVLRGTSGGGDAV